MKSVAAALAVILAFAAALYLWVTRETSETRLEIVDGRTIRSVLVEGPEDVRPAVLPAIPVDLPSLPGTVLVVSYEVHTKGRTSTSTWSATFHLSYEPGPPAVWILKPPFEEAVRAASREEAVDLLLRSLEDYCRGKTT